ncbi:FAD binding domain-containing protein [Corynascus similis CBS 632.67]
MTYDCDVLIIGAGPVGTALALELALHRVSFRIVDREPIRSDKSRALVIQPRTLELLNRHGAADAIVQRGRIVRGAATYINKQPASRVILDDLGTTDTEFTLPLNVSQAETERFLDECLSKYDLSVERPVTATSIIQDGAGVTVTLERPGGKNETVRAKYVVGCDGAHSVVRHASDKMAFPGGQYPQDFILCDAQLRDSNVVQDRLTMYISNKGILGVLPVDGKLIRVVASSGPVAVSGQEVPTLDQFQAYFTAMTPPGSGTLHSPLWLTRFRLHHRCVSQYRDGRLFVAGDAAHIHSPAGGQGMNAGIQDSINLGWKLARALSLQQSGSPKLAAAADALLDTYDLERRPIGLMLLRGTDRIFSFIAAPPNSVFVLFRNFFLRYIAPRVARSRARRKKMFHFISQFGVNYRGRTRLVGEATGSFLGWRAIIRGGDRLPDGKVWSKAEERETSLQRICVGAPHHLLLFSGDAARGGLGEGELESAAERVMAACQADVRVHYVVGDDRPAPGKDWYTDPAGELHAKFGFGRKAGYVLVRPDGYVAHIGPLSKLQQLLSFLDGYLVSSVVTPPPSSSSLFTRLGWVVVGAGLAFQLIRQITQRV